MNNLTLIKKDGQHWVDSRQVAQMVEKEHSHLCRDIDGYIFDMAQSQNPILDSDKTSSQNSNLNPDSFFFKSSYKAGTGKNYTCYLISRKGCDFIGNKMTGEKGTLFTAAYVSTFHAMDEKIRQQATRQVDIAAKKALSLAATIEKYMGVRIGLAQSVSIQMMEDAYNVSLEPLKKLLPAAEHETGFLNPTEIGNKLGGLKAAKVNNLLKQLGLQKETRDHKNRLIWRLTDDGKQYAEEKPYTNHGHSDYQIQWNESVIAVLNGQAVQEGV